MFLEFRKGSTAQKTYWCNQGGILEPMCVASWTEPVPAAVGPMLIDVSRPSYDNWKVLCWKCDFFNQQRWQIKFLPLGVSSSLLTIQGQSWGRHLYLLDPFFRALNCFLAIIKSSYNQQLYGVRTYGSCRSLWGNYDDFCGKRLRMSESEEHRDLSLFWATWPNTRKTRWSITLLLAIVL